MSTNAATWTDEQHFAYRWKYQAPTVFWQMYYPKTDALSTADLVALVKAQAPDLTAPGVHTLLPTEAERRVLDCHVARLYQRFGPASIEAEYERKLEEQYQTAIDNAGEGATEAQIDAAYDALPPVLVPAQIAVQRAIDSLT